MRLDYSEAKPAYLWCVRHRENLARMYSRLDGMIAKFRAKLARLEALIIDDFALSPIKTGAYGLVLDRRRSFGTKPNHHDRSAFP